MALGIPLSSLDVVVGISGVHYVLQGLRQIDRELSAANNKKVRTALDFPDPSGQLRTMRDAFGQTSSSVMGLGTVTRDTFNAMKQPVANPLRQLDARNTIQQYQQVKSQVTLLRKEADLASRDFQRADKALKDFLRVERPQQHIVNQSATNQQQITDRILAQRARNFDDEIKATSSGQRWFQRGSAADMRNIDLARDARRVQQANAVRKFQQDLRDEQARAAAAQTFLSGRDTQRNYLRFNQVGANRTLADRNAELGAAETHLSGLTRAAAMAKEYLSQTAGFLNPIQWLSGVLRGLIGFIPVLANMGMGLVRVGGAALGALGHIGSFALKVIQLPAIMGPLTGGLSLIADNFMAIAGSIALVIGALAGLTFKSIITEGMQLEQSLSSVKAVLQYSFVENGVVNLDKVNASMRELDFITLQLGADTAFSNQEVAQTIEFLLRGGVSAQVLSSDMVRATLNLATATGATLETSAGAINDLIGMWGLAATQIPALANMIAGAVNTSRMDPSDFVNAMRQVGPLAAAMGITPEDTTTALAMLGQKGFRGEIAGTAFRNMLLYLNPRSKPAQEAMEGMGLWVPSGDTPGDPDDPAYQKKLRDFNQTQNERRARLATLQQRLSEQRSSGAASSTIMGTQNQIDALVNDINTALAPVAAGTKGGGHSVFYDNLGNLKPLEEIINLLASTGQKLNDQQKAEFYQDVFGTRSGSAALLFSSEDAAQFKKTKELISAVDVQTLANFKLDNVAGAIELLTGSLQSLAGVVFINWIASPLKNFIMWLDSKSDVVLDFFGKKMPADSALGIMFGAQSRGKMGIDQLFKELQTGNMDAFIGNLAAIAPELVRFEPAARKIFRAMQLVRDGIITFKDAFAGNWAGQGTRSINGLIRIIGVFGLYWGVIWRNVLGLLTGKIDFRTFFTNLGKNFFDLMHNLGITLAISGPVVAEALRTMLKGLGEIGGALWTEVVQPGMAFLWGELTKWWKVNGPGIKSQVGDMLGGAFDFLTRRRVVTTHYNELGQVTGEEATPAGFFDLVQDSFRGLIGPALTTMWNGATSWLTTNADMLKQFGKDVATLIGDGLSFLWSDDGMGIGRALARGLSGVFTGLGVGIINASEGVDSIWDVLYGKTPTGGMGTSKPDTGIGEEFKRAFIIMAVDVLLIFNLLMTSFINLMMLGIKEAFKGLVGVVFVVILGIGTALATMFNKIMGLLPKGVRDAMGWNDFDVKGTQKEITTSYDQWMGGIDDWFNKNGKYQTNTLDPEQFRLFFEQESSVSGVYTTGPNRGQRVPQGMPGYVPDNTSPAAVTGPGGETYGIVGPQFVNPGGTDEAGKSSSSQLVMGPDGPVWIPKNTTPGTRDIPSTYNPNDPFNTRENHTGESGPGAAGAVIDTINAYGLGVDEFLDEVIARLEERYGSA